MKANMNINISTNAPTDEVSSKVADALSNGRIDEADRHLRSDVSFIFDNRNLTLFGCGSVSLCLELIWLGKMVLLFGKPANMLVDGENIFYCQKSADRVNFFLVDPREVPGEGNMLGSSSVHGFCSTIENAMGDALRPIQPFQKEIRSFLWRTPTSCLSDLLI
jgi:hypothetical protein